MALYLAIAMVQITHNLNSSRVSHAWSEHTRMGFLDSTKRVHAHTVFTHTRAFTCVHACMANVASYVAS